MKFLLERFYSLTAYTRLILLGSLLLAVVCLFLSALYGYLAAGEQYLRYLALSERLLEASWSSLGAGCLSAMLCEAVWRKDFQE